MSKVAVVYWSGTGNTEIMANCVVEGAMNGGAQADLYTATEFGPEKINDYDVIAFGCPSMGDEILEEAEFQPMWDSVLPELGGKKVALFGSYGWGDGEWMRIWEQECKDGGVNIICPCVMANETPDDNAKDDCRGLGDMIARG